MAWTAMTRTGLLRTPVLTSTTILPARAADNPRAFAARSSRGLLTATHSAVDTDSEAPSRLSSASKRQPPSATGGRAPTLPRPDSRRFSSWCSPTSVVRSPPSPPSRDPGGKPNDGSHRTVYDDFNNILSGGEASPIVVHSMDDTSITLTDGLVVSQPVVFLDGNVLLWRAPTLDASRAAPNGQGWEAWLSASRGEGAEAGAGAARTTQELVREVWGVFEVVTPRPEVILFGTGKTVLPPPPPIKAYLNSLGIQVDVQSTRNACSTYNLLIEEGRKVAAALLPNVRRGP